MKLILHIGCEKTGTSSIQKALASDREAFSAGGILFPKLHGWTNHTEIAVAAMNPSRGDELQIRELTRAGCDNEEYRRRIRAMLRDEIAAGGHDRLLISNEHCHSRLRRPVEVQRLADLFDGIADEITVIVYLRRQDRMAVSSNSTRLKVGGRGPIFPPEKPGVTPPYFDFEALLRRYSKVFGAGNIRVRIYERALLADGDVVADFYETAALGRPGKSVPELNTSVSAAQYRFLQKFNARFPLLRDGKVNPERGPIYARIQNVLTGPPFRPARADAEAFYARFAEGNARVHRDYRPDLDRPTLFEEDFSSYPETADSEELTAEEVLDFTAAIWRAYGKLNFDRK